MDSRIEFHAFLNAVEPEPVEILGMLFNRADAILKLDPDAYEGIFEAWLESQDKPTLRLVQCG